MEYIIVGIGGVLGSITRYKLGEIISRKASTFFPFGTFIINITGAFLLGIVSSAVIGSNVYIIIVQGFLGAYTTFSTFMYEGFNLIKGKKILNALIYITGSLFLGISGFILGMELGKIL